jgi:uncharacterized protein YdeI (BOF family)
VLQHTFALANSNVQTLDTSPNKSIHQLATVVLERHIVRRIGLDSFDWRIDLLSAIQAASQWEEGGEGGVQATTVVWH